MTQQTKTPVALACDGVSRFFGSVRALHRVSLTIHQGEVLCLVGDNGAGKSTLAGILSGKLRPDEGTIVVDQHAKNGYSIAQAQGLGIESVYQHLALCDKLTAAENIVLGREPSRFPLGPLSLLNRGEAARIAQEQIARVGGRLPRLDVPIEKFSGGQRQAVAIARAVFRASRLVILDEPTAALGVKQTAAILDIIRGVASQGIAVLMISHNLADVFDVADRIVALRLGEVALDAPKVHLTAQELRECMAGLPMETRQ